MARERLTSRARQAADDKTPYPGSINQEGRVEEQRGSMTYRTFEPSVANHERTNYERVHGVSDQHNEMGFGIPDPASGMLAASSQYQAKCIKAAELAETFLGPKVSDRMLLAQARDFLNMEDDILERTLERFNRTDSLYIAEEAEEAIEAEEAEEGEEAVVAEDDAEDDAVVAEEEVEEAVEEVAEVEDGEGEEEAAVEEAVAQEAVVQEAPVPSQTPAEEATDSPVRDIPAMPEGHAASPQVNTETAPAAVSDETMYMSEARATNLAQLAACTLQAQECTQENIVKQAKKFASLSDNQVKELLAGYGREAADCVAEETEEAEEAETACMKPAEDVAEVEENEVEVASIQDVDISSFDLSEEFNDGPVTATEDDKAELASIFDDEAAMQVPQMPNPVDALTASIAALSGNNRSKTASKVGVKSIGNATLQNNQPMPSNTNELEGLWNSPSEFPGGGF